MHHLANIVLIRWHWGKWRIYFIKWPIWALFLGFCWLCELFPLYSFGRDDDNLFPLYSRRNVSTLIHLLIWWVISLYFYHKNWYLAFMLETNERKTFYNTLRSEKYEIHTASIAFISRESFFFFFFFFLFFCFAEALPHPVHKTERPPKIGANPTLFTHLPCFLGFFLKVTLSAVLLTAEKGQKRGYRVLFMYFFFQFQRKSQLHQVFRQPPPSVLTVLWLVNTCLL